MRILFLVLVQTIMTLSAEDYWAGARSVEEVPPLEIREEAGYSPPLPLGKRVPRENIRNIFGKLVRTFRY